MSGPILFINPNSSQSVTDGIARALVPLRIVDGPAFEAVCIAHGPPTIASAEDAARAAVNVADMVRARPDCSAYVIACFSDPGLEVARSLTSRPVLGLQEAGILAALGRADLFGIVALGPASVARHRLRIRFWVVWLTSCHWIAPRPKMLAILTRYSSRRCIWADG